MLTFNAFIVRVFFFSLLRLTTRYHIATHYKYIMCVHAQSCPTLCDPVDCSLRGSSVHGILQARKLGEWSFLSLGDLPDLETKPTSPVSHALVGGFFTTAPPGKPIHIIYTQCINIMYKYIKYISLWLAIDSLYQKNFLQDKITLLGMIH